MKKEFYNIEVVNVVAAINQILSNGEKAKDLPIKFRWALKKNISALSPTVKNFEEFRQELIDELQSEYFNEEKSHIDKDDNGNEIRKVNDEYMEEYGEKVNELNEKLQELLGEKNEYEISTVDMDDFVNGLPSDTALEFDDIEILSFMEE